MSETQPPNTPSGRDRGPIRVLVVAASLDIVGGQSIQADLLVSRWRGEGDVTVDFLPVNPRLPGPLRLLQRVKYLRTAVTWPWYWLSLLRRVPGYTIIHAFSASYLSFVLAPTPAILVAKLFRKKIILNYHSGEAEDHLRRWRRTAIPTIRWADAVVVPSEYLVRTFEGSGLKARAIFNIVETGQFRFRERRPLQPRFLSNRNLEPMYNVANVLKAFSLIQQRVPNATLTVVGDGSQRASLERLSFELGLGGVTFLGRVAPGEMPGIYADADIFLNASEIDNMPLSILEAFSAGLPVVTTGAGGIPFVVKDGETGLVVRIGDYQGLAERALAVLADPALADAVVRQARADCARYTWEAVRGRWLSVYEELSRQANGADSGTLGPGEQG